MKKLALMLNSFLESTTFGLTDSDINNAKSLLEHGEYGVAFELICDQLYEHDTPLERKHVDMAKKIANLMMLDDNSWDFLNNNIQ